MRRVSNLRIGPSDSDAEHAIKTLADGTQTLGQLIRRGVHPDTVLHLVGRGRAHFDLTKELHEKLSVDTRPNPDFYQRLLGSRNDPESWWHSLPDL